MAGRCRKAPREHFVLDAEVPCNAAARAEALGAAAVVRRDACNNTAVGEAVPHVLDNAGYTARVRAISKRLQTEAAVSVRSTDQQTQYHPSQNSLRASRVLGTLVKRFNAHDSGSL